MPSSLSDLRKQIDTLDADIVQCLISGGGSEGLNNIIERRHGIVREIGAYKQARGLPILDEKRREEMIRSRVDQAPESHKQVIQHFFETMHDMSVRIQTEQKNLQK